MKFLRKLIHSGPVQSFMNNSVLMNWSNLNKSILVLFLGGIDHILWIIWFSIFSSSPSSKHWFNAEYATYHLNRMYFCCLLSFILILFCHYLRHHHWVQRYFPFIAMGFFGVSFIYGGYSIGIISPVTIAGYISIVTVGLVLFERRMVYCIFIPITVYLVIAILLTMMGKMQYAPIYSDEFNHSILYRNSFWVYTQLYFYIPIFFTALVLFEILLTQWRNREKQIKEISQIDPLTGIYNRRKIGRKLTELKATDEKFALVLLDLDHFKKINDSYGHDVGDQVLKRVAKILSNHIRGEDIVGRFGGEEFILVLKNKSLAQALALAEYCRAEIEKEDIYLHKQGQIKISASFGVSISQSHLSKEMIVRQADQALYQAKHQGRNQVHYFNESSESI